MSNKKIVTLRSAPSVSVEIPEQVKVEGSKDKTRPTARSCFGAVRLFPGVPKTVTEDELEHIRMKDPDTFRRLDVRPYVESKRVDLRGAGEADVERLAEAEGIGHLKFKAKVEKLQERGKVKKPEKRTAAPATPAPTTKRKARNGNGDK